MKRKEFITLLGVGAGTVVVASCLGGCGKGGEPAPDPAPGAPVLTLNNVSTNIDLNDPNKSYIVQSGVIVAKTGANSYVALGGACTHAGNPMTYNKTNNNFPCSLTDPPNPGHGSIFDANGVLLSGPANGNLKKYTYTLENDTLKVFA
jgi:cytochrome b6-f complex iron-sulfur subunit